MKNARKRQSMYASTGDGYEAARYGDPYKELYREMRNETLLNTIDEHFGIETPLKILEIGCGTGVTLEYLAKLPSAHELYGLDFSSTMLSHAFQKLKALKNKFYLSQGDSFELPFPGSTFNVVYSTRFIHQFTHDQKKKIYKEILRILKPGGVIIIEFYTRHNKWLRYMRGLQEDLSLDQCPTLAEVRDIVGISFKVCPIRMIGLTTVVNLMGIKALRRLTSLTNKPLLRNLAEEYFVISGKNDHV